MRIVPVIWLDSRLAAALWAALLALMIVAPVSPAAEDDEPPIVGQPPHFNGAVGRFRVTAIADPVKLQAEDPLTYTVRVTATAEVKQPPQRSPLAEFPGFASGFYIEDIGPPGGTHPDDKTWEFAYRLKPKNTAVQSIPGFPFVFFRPGLLPPSRGYMTARVPERPITVTPREGMPGITPTQPIRGPEAAFVLAEGDVLRRDGDGRLPGSLSLALLLLAPPACCLAWYYAWRRVHPDAARRAHRRRSRAAREALRSLRGIDRRQDPEDRACRAAAAVAGYLRQRLELPMSEPTPAEAETHLRGHGVSEKLASQTAECLRTCAAVRFAPKPPPSADLAANAAQLVLALEAETWAE